MPSVLGSSRPPQALGPPRPVAAAPYAWLRRAHWTASAGRTSTPSSGRRGCHDQLDLSPQRPTGTPPAGSPRRRRRHYSLRDDGERRAQRLHPRRRRCRRTRGPGHGGRDALPARAERLPPYRPSQGDRAQLRDREAVRRPLQPAVRRHEPGQGGAGVHRRDPAGHPLARLRLGRPPLLRVGLLPPALRLGPPPDQGRQRVRRRPVGRRDPRAPRHAHRAGQGQSLARPLDRGEPRPVRAHARRRVPGRREGAEGQARHGVAEHQPARPGALPDPACDPSAHRRRVVHLSAVRLRAWPVRRDRRRHALALHARVRRSPAALRLAAREPAGALAPEAVRVLAPQLHVHGALEALPRAARERGRSSRRRIAAASRPRACATSSTASGSAAGATARSRSRRSSTRCATC